MKKFIQNLRNLISKPIEADGDTGIVAVQFETPNGTILVD